MYYVHSILIDGLCGVVVRVSGYRSRGPGFDSRRYQILREVVGLEGDLLSIVSITEEIFKWKSSGSGSRKPTYVLVFPVVSFLLAFPPILCNLYFSRTTKRKALSYSV
jgi:hypothetical protein